MILFLSLVLAELEEALVVSYLTSNRHNYSHLLDRLRQRPHPRWCAA